MSITLATVGNPNSGKTTLFNGLTGANQKVGNWSGVTVDKKTGHFNVGQQSFSVTDLPGIYSLDDNGDSSSIDERIAFEYVSQQAVDLIVNVVDATAIERSLYLTMQLKELGLPMIVVLNKMDSAKKNGLSINTKALSKQLNCPVVALAARQASQVDGFKNALLAFSQELTSIQSEPALTLAYGDDLEQALDAIAPLLTDLPIAMARRGLALKCLELDATILKLLNTDAVNQVYQVRRHLEQQCDIDLQLADVRYSAIYQACQQSVSEAGKLSLQTTERIDRWVLHPVLGVPIFLAVMYLLFMFSINIGSSFIDFFDISFGAVFVDGFGLLLSNLGSPVWLTTILAGGIGAGIQTVATFIPVIACLYLFLTLLESSGYLARAAFVVDKLMQKMGLPGKSFVPMIVGFGCSVPAIMAARTLDKERERLLTSIMSPFMSCGARLPVYALFAAAFFPSQGQNLVFALYLIGILAAIFTGLVLSRTLLPGKTGNMILELPDYEVPKLMHVWIKMWHKLKAFIFGAGKTIVVVVAVLSFVNSIGTDGSFGNEDSEQSVLSITAQAVTPILAPMGVTQDNWPATVGVLTGIFAKEAVVGTLNNLYSAPESEDGAEFSLIESLQEAVASIPANLSGLSFSDPMGIEVGEVGDLSEAAAEQEVNVSVFSNMQAKFDGKAGAFAYLLFILLYTPCAAAMGALVREIGRNWAIFTGVWTGAMAYGSAVLVYQIASFQAHPGSSLAWIAAIIAITLATIAVMRRKGDLLAMGGQIDPAKVTS
ncbi:Fe(2+) transporter permease subunit FeoB [Motilimonas pumila]|uniref:Ferrous iron transport protein B n=1 Tax=Motilimonas pumila TaxID=2303987 RepID=A0A418YF81_9GAMM|nr:Fe(2+) transporter permease subunit FeoB [Motilimonas pumila]RJG47728.1 Fe(2+) transporter permease subunit FeoB [Motilimonas pumila]